MPFRNILAEWHARDTSRKIRAIFGARTAAGNHVTGALPYGYLHDPKDRQKWIVEMCIRDSDETPEKFTRSALLRHENRLYCKCHK